MHAGLRSGTAVWTVKTKLWHFSTVMIQCESSSNLFVWNHVAKWAGIAQFVSGCGLVTGVWISTGAIFFCFSSSLIRTFSVSCLASITGREVGTSPSYHGEIEKCSEFWLFFFCPMTIVRQPKQIYTYSCTDDFEFRVCKSMHHHTFNWINQQDAASSKFITCRLTL